MYLKDSIMKQISTASVHKKTKNILIHCTLAVES